MRRRLPGPRGLGGDGLVNSMTEASSRVQACLGRARVRECLRAFREEELWFQLLLN